MSDLSIHSGNTAESAQAMAAEAVSPSIWQRLAQIADSVVDKFLKPLIQTAERLLQQLQTQSATPQAAAHDKQAGDEGLDMLKRVLPGFILAGTVLGNAIQFIAGLVPQPAPTAR